MRSADDKIETLGDILEERLLVPAEEVKRGNAHAIVAGSEHYSQAR